MCVCVVSILVEAKISRKRKCAFKSITNIYKMCRLAQQLTVHLFHVWRWCSERSTGWSVCELRQQPAHRVFRHLMSAQPSPRGDMVSLFSPLFPFLSPPPSAPTCHISYSKPVCLEMSTMVTDFFIYLGLCNTLVYAVSFFSHGLLCVQEALYFHPEKTRYRFLA